MKKNLLKTQGGKRLIQELVYLKVFLLQVLILIFHILNNIFYAYNLSLDHYSLLLLKYDKKIIVGIKIIIKSRKNFQYQDSSKSSSFILI